MGAALHAAADRGCSALPASGRRSLVHGRDLCEGRRAVALRVPGDRPVRAGHRRVCLHAAGCHGGPPVLEQAIGTTKVMPVEVVTDLAPLYPAVLDELLPAAWHRTGLGDLIQGRGHGFSMPCLVPTQHCRQAPPGLIPRSPADPGFDVAQLLTTRHRWFASARLRGPHLTRSRHAFSATLTTTPALDRRSLRWFATSPCMGGRGDLPPSLGQHRSRVVSVYIEALLHVRVTRRPATCSSCWASRADSCALCCVTVMRSSLGRSTMCSAPRAPRCW